MGGGVKSLFSLPTDSFYWTRSKTQIRQMYFYSQSLKVRELVTWGKKVKEKVCILVSIWPYNSVWFLHDAYVPLSWRASVILSSLVTHVDASINLWRTRALVSLTKAKGRGFPECSIGYIVSLSCSKSLGLTSIVSCLYSRVYVQAAERVESCYFGFKTGTVQYCVFKIQSFISQVL